MSAVAVVGAGVVGLTAARALEDAGFAVRVIAEKSGLEESSGAAGAVWFLYAPEVGEADRPRVHRMARESHAWLSELARSVPAAGVRVVETWVSARDDAPPEWAGSMPVEAELAFVETSGVPIELRREADSRPAGGAWRFRAPVVVPPRHLAWLEHGLARPIERRRVDDLAQVDADAVVHCTGPAAERLVDDAALEPRMGRTVVATTGRLPRDRVLMDDRHEGGIFYAIPRGEGGAEVVLGGSDVPRSLGATLEPSPEAVAAILARHAERGIVPEGPVREHIGWRPGRNGGPRVELEGRVVHAYGHGGAGFTLARGTALVVVELVREALGA